MVVENSEIVYNDGIKKLFLYTGGQIGGNEELGNLLRYLSETKETNAVDTDLKQEIIDYEKLDSYNEGHEEGLKEGIKEGRIRFINACRQLGADKQKAEELLINEYSLDRDEAKELININW